MEMEKLNVYKKYFETASDNDHLVMHRGYALALVKMVEDQRRETERMYYKYENLQRVVGVENRRNEKYHQLKKMLKDILSDD